MAIKFESKPEPGIAVKIDQAIATTEIVHPDKSVTTDTEVVKEILTTSPVCNVGMNASRTINLGNYNNIKIGVSLFMPCPVNEIEGAYDFVKNWVDNKMELLSSEVEEAQK